MSDIRYYTADQVREALPMANAIDAMRVAFGELSAGRVQLPQRAVVPSENGAVTLVMSGRCDVRFGLGAKIVSVFPGNRAKGKPTIHAMVVLLDDQTGEPVALIDGESLTAIRTGAASGLATDLLARPDASTVAIVGAGGASEDAIGSSVCGSRRSPGGRVRSLDCECPENGLRRARCGLVGKCERGSGRLRVSCRGRR